MTLVFPVIHKFLPILLFSTTALAQEPTEEEEDPLAPYRTRFDALAGRTIGSASKPVAYNWRRNTAQIAATGSFLFELNNFNSYRGGLMVRIPTSGLLVEVGASYVGVWDTPSSKLLAFTPYRQPGRPNRVEVDIGVAYPLAEGVVTSFPGFFPSVQMVFNAYADFRYVIHPTGYKDLTALEVGSAIFSPSLSQAEIDNLNDVRLDAMKVDPGRYGLMLGLGNDLYFENGLFISPKLLLAVPILAPATRTDLLFWADFSLAIGVGF